MFLCRDRVWPNGEVLCCDITILCRDIVGQVRKIFCHDRGFLGRDRVGQGKEKLCCDIVGQGREKFCRYRGLPGCDRAGHDRGVMSPTTESGVHDRHARATGMHARQVAGTTGKFYSDRELDLDGA